MGSRGFRFLPSDDELISFLDQKLHGAACDSPILFECDLYCGKEPWEIWNEHGGLRLKKGEELYFFTRLKKVSKKGSRCNRRTGSGTWSGVNCVRAGSGGVAEKRYFKYKNGSGGESDCEWKMYEYSLVDGAPDSYVVCRLRREIKGEKRKSTNSMETHGYYCSRSSSSVDVHQQQMIKKHRVADDLHVGAGDNGDVIDFVFLFDYDGKELEKIKREEHINNLSAAAADFGFLFDSDGQELEKITREEDVNNLSAAAAADFGFLFDSDGQESEKITREEHVNNLSAAAAEVANSSPPSTTRDHHPVEAEIHNKDPDVGVHSEAAAAQGNGGEDDSDPSGEESFAEMLKDVPLYYIDDHKDVSIDLLSFFDM